MDRMKARILNELKAGNAVSLLDLGTMYLGIKGSFTMDAGNTDASALKGKELTVGFTASEDVQSAVSMLKVGSVSLSLKAPAVNSVINLATKKEDKILSIGKGAELKGNRLKVTGEGCGVWFAPLDSDGNRESDESKWISVPEQNILKNYPKSVIIQVPDTITAGKYQIAIRTCYSGGNSELKLPVTGYSFTVEVA